MDCIFCQIGSGEAAAVKLFEDSDIVAFLDRSPIREGHTQIITKKHFETFENMPIEIATKVMKLGQNLAAAQKRLYGVNRVAFCFTGSDVPHVHAHVVPMYTQYDITSREYIVSEDTKFDSTHLRRSAEELKKVSEKIVAELKL